MSAASLSSMSLAESRDAIAMEDMRNISAGVDDNDSDWPHQERMSGNSVDIAVSAVSFGDNPFNDEVQVTSSDANEDAAHSGAKSRSRVMFQDDHRDERSVDAALSQQEVSAQHIQSSMPSAEFGTPAVQGRPAEMTSLAEEALFVLVCSVGQLLFGFSIGQVAGLQLILIDLLSIEASQTPWLTGSFLLANGLSVIVSGSLADLYRPKHLIVGAFTWQLIWNIIGVFSLHNKYLFFLTRGNLGISVGILVSASISVLGRIYQPGLRKTRVFSIMAGMAPLGFWVGTLQGGALYHSPKWIFASSAIVSAACIAMAIYAIPNVQPTLHNLGLRSFDFYGSALAVTGCALLVAGLTQGPSAEWAPYAIVVVLLGLLFLAAFFYVETKVRRPLLPPGLWRIPGFTTLIISYFLGFGSFVAWQFFAIQFWLEVQQVSPLTVALYMIPNAIFGVLAVFIVSRITHLVKGHWILAASMLAYSLGPVFFLPQQSNTIYWALSMPGIALVTFGPDLSFAAASIFVTSSVARSYQGSAGSLLVTVQNLSAAVMTSLSESIGDKTGRDDSLRRLHSIWWFDFAAAIFAAFLILVGVRMPKAVEKEHEQ